MSSKVLIALGVVAAVGVAFWLGFSGGNVSVSPPVASSPSSKAIGTKSLQPESSAFFTRARASKAQMSTTPTVETSPANTNLITNWEDYVDQALRDNSEAEAKAREMLALLPRFPEAGQVETAHHIANLLADADYEQFGQYLTNSKTPEDVQDVVLADVLNRPDAIKLPLLLATARNPDNAKAAEAKDILGLYLAEDYGNNWDQWQQAVGKWLKENPD